MGAALMLIRIPTRLLVITRLGAWIDERTFRSRDQYDDAAGGDAVLALVHFAVMIALFVLFIILARRLVTNALALGARPRVSPGMAVGAWFIPVYCLAGPYNAIAGSHDAVASHDPEPEQAKRRHLITAWWLLFITAQVVGDWIATLVGISAGANAIGGIDESTTAVDLERDLDQGLQVATVIGFIGQLVLIAAAIVGWFAIGHIVARQERVATAAQLT